jgi:hypothetical protein
MSLSPGHFDPEQPAIIPFGFPTHQRFFPADRQPFQIPVLLTIVSNTIKHELQRFNKSFESQIPIADI